MIDHVNPKRTKFTIEMMGWSIPDGPDSYLKLIHAVDRKEFGVHMDACNGVNCPTRLYQNADFIRECFEKLGPTVTSKNSDPTKTILHQIVIFLTQQY
ncbi:MAG: hypothetical protein ABSH49_13480 [Bryobacteraceae bacterium]